MIRLTTNFGTIDIELDYKNAPVTASNFEQYVKDGHYNGLIFHRVIPGFMIQGGGFKPGMDEVDTREPIKNEANNGLSNEKYTIAMARTNDPHSASAQFFINVADNKFLDFKSETMPVSYTHLDVYKRQAFSCQFVVAGNGCFKGFNRNAHLLSKFIQCLSLIHILPF